MIWSGIGRFNDEIQKINQYLFEINWKYVLKSY